MHSPQPFPLGSAPFAVQSRPVSNRTYSAEIPRLICCRHNRSAATSRIIAYQKRSHARISLTHPPPVCKPFFSDFPDFFHFFLPTPHLVPSAVPLLQNREVLLIFILPILYIRHIICTAKQLFSDRTPYIFHVCKSFMKVCANSTLSLQISLVSSVLVRGLLFTGK